MSVKFYQCNHCGNISVMLVDSSVVPVCCGEKMTELKAKTLEEMDEIHLPVVERGEKCALKVSVGSEAHPMTQGHYIRFVVVETTRGAMFHYLRPGEKPETTFCDAHDPAIAVYEYCNIHGLWKTELDSQQKHTQTTDYSKQYEGSSCGMKNRRNLFILFCSLLFPMFAFATHNNSASSTITKALQQKDTPTGIKCAIYPNMTSCRQTDNKVITACWSDFHRITQEPSIVL